jgi:hypothetical protein
MHADLDRTLVTKGQIAARVAEIGRQLVRRERMRHRL